MEIVRTAYPGIHIVSSLAPSCAVHPLPIPGPVVFDLPEPTHAEARVLDDRHREMFFRGPTPDARSGCLRPTRALVFDESEIGWPQRVPLRFRHPAVPSKMDPQLAVVVLSIRKTMQHCRTEELDADICRPFIRHFRPATNYRYSVERFIKRFDPNFGSCWIELVENKA